MDAQTCFIAYFDDDPKKFLKTKPRLNRPASHALAERMFPNHTLEEMTDGTLASLAPNDAEVFVGVYRRFRVIAYLDFGSFFPSSLNPRWVQADLGTTAYLHATHSEVDWFAFAIWHNGRLKRALSVTPDDAVIENIGIKLPFEAPFWSSDLLAGDEEVEPDDDPYPLPFHPPDMAEAAMFANLGFSFGRDLHRRAFELKDIDIMRFRLAGKLKLKHG